MLFMLEDRLARIECAEVGLAGRPPSLGSLLLVIWRDAKDLANVWLSVSICCYGGTRP